MNVSTSYVWFDLLIFQFKIRAVLNEFLVFILDNNDD